MAKYKSEHGYEAVEQTLQRRLAENAPTRLQLLVGPRQVGKTTLLLELEEKHRSRAIYVSADVPEAALPFWADGVWRQALDRARHKPAILLIDEIQYLPQWSRWLKARFDEVRRKKIPLHVIVTGSSSLKIGAGANETMAGRFERLTLTHWGAADLVMLLGVLDAVAPERIVSHGGYPGAVAYWNEPARWRTYLRDSVIEPAIGRDILQLEVVRKPALLRQLFALASAHPAEILSLEKIAGSLAEKGALETLAHYLELLSGAFLVAGLQRYAGDEIRRRRSPPKLVVLNNALLAGSRASLPPDPQNNPAEWGRWLENACLAHAINSGQEVFYWREEPWEVDAMIKGSWGQWLVEVKSGDYGLADLRGLAQAAAKFPQFLPIVICDPDRESAAQSAGFRAVSWRAYLLNGLPPH
jgi:predicted AAA+ superfamily ATPase